MIWRAPRHPPVARSRVLLDYFLLIASLLGLLLYIPVVPFLPDATHLRFDPLHLGVSACLLGPPAAMSFAIVAALLWVFRRGGTDRSRLRWAILCTLGLLGWPVSCSSAAVLSHEGGLLAP
jgi:hypothetical protein